MRKRIFSLILTCVVLLTCVFGSITVANAAYPTEPIDYRDLDYTVKEGYAYNEVTVPLSYEFCRLVVTEDGSSTPVASVQGDNLLSFGVEHSTNYDATLYPVSYRGLSLANIPEGSRLVFDLYINCVYTDVLENTVNRPMWGLFQNLRYIKADNKQTGNTIREEIDGFSNEYIKVTFDLDSYPDGAVAVVPYITMDNFNFDRGVHECEITLVNVSLVMDISNGYWEQWVVEQNGQMIDNLGDRIEGSINDSTDRIEGAIGDSADKIQGTLENQWNADVESSKPVGSDKVESADNVESAVRDDAQAGLDKGNELQSNAGNILKSANIAVAFACVAKLFGLFANISFFSDLLTISVALGIFSLLVNLANSVSAWNRREVAKAEREQRRQESAERYSRHKH